MVLLGSTWGMDSRKRLRVWYSVQNEGVERVVIHGDDTDIITTCLYYVISQSCGCEQVRTPTYSYMRWLWHWDLHSVVPCCSSTA